MTDTTPDFEIILVDELVVGDVMLFGERRPFTELEVVQLHRPPGIEAQEVKLATGPGSRIIKLLALLDYVTIKPRAAA